MPRSLVYDFARYYKANVPCGASFFELLWAFGKAKLPEIGDEELLAIIHTRIASNSSFNAADSALMEVDEALEVVEPMDQKSI
eukprot:9641028-Alexandrium_andersonii.AAC.1